MKKSLSVIILTLFSILFFIGCEIGLGEEVDLEGPVISVTSLTSGGLTVPSTEFAGGVYCQKQVSFAGTAEDNVKLKSVHAEIKWSNENDYTYLEEVKLKDNNWTYNYEFDKEGAVFIKFVAEDEPGNISTKSSTVLTLYVDDTPPEGSGWYIDRGNGFTYNLQTRQTLERFANPLPNDDPLTLPENKDAAQNEKFSIHADFNDTMGIKGKTVKIRIKDITGKQICEVQNRLETDENGNQNENLYAPQFDITHEMLVAGDSNLATGRHLLQVFYDAEDVVTLPSSNKTENHPVEVGWFLWYPESDEPQIVPQTTLTGGKISLNIKDTLSISIFDDDGLDGTHVFKLVEKNNQSNDIATKTLSFNGERDMTVTLKAPDDPIDLVLLASAKDKKSAGVTPKEKDLSIDVNVIDNTTPIVIVQSPVNNTIPTVTMQGSGSSQKANITIAGEVLDTLGCQYLEFVWVPDAVTSNKTEKINKAKAYLDSTPISVTAPVAGAQSAINAEGLKKWGVMLGTKSNYGSTSFKTQPYSFTVDLLNDFKYTKSDGTIINEKGKNKFFYIKLTRESASGKPVYQEYTLLKDDSAPLLTIQSKVTDQTNQTQWLSMSDMSVFESTKAITLRFSASKSSGLAMDESSYKITRAGVSNDSISSVYSNSYCTYTIDTTTLGGFEVAGTKPTYRFYAKDILGNEVTVDYTIVISNLTKLTGISTTAPKKCKVGDEIILNANFSNTIHIDEGLPVSDLPYIKIKGIKNGSTTVDKAYCNYKNGKAVGSGTTTIQFVYKVKEGDKTEASKKLEIDADSTESPIEKNGATSLDPSKVHLSGAGVDWTDNVSSKNITVDGISPKVSTITFESSDATNNTDATTGKTYLREGRNFTVKVATSEAISIQGIPSFKVKSGSSVKLIPLDSAQTTSTLIVFSTNVTSDWTEDEIKYVKNACIDNTDVITDSVGNKLLLQTGTDETNTNFIFDKTPPEKPSIKNSSGEDFSSGSNYFKEKATFKVLKPDITKEINKDVSKLYYSLDGGSTWPSSQTVAANTSKDITPPDNNGYVYQLTARCEDYAGNVSEYPTPVTLDVRNTFPSFTLECTNADGYYAAGQKINFKITFASKVRITNTNAKIYLEGTTVPATLTSSTGTVTSALFEYEVKKTDQFKLTVSKNVDTNHGVHLDGIEDLYGCTQGTKSFSTTADFTREITCDGIIPYITSMRPDEETSSGSNIYKKGNKITIVFNEPVQKGSGNITLRQVAGWAIPPVISAQDFNTICNNLTAEQKNTLSMQENGEDMEDSECTIGNNPKNPQDAYHGTGQFVGPYKKSSQGLKKVGNNYVPDTSTKYVLAFDLDIWDTDITKTMNVGKTFTPGETSARTGSLSQGSIAATSVITPSETRSTQQIREVLEAAHFHERILDVTSSKITASSDNITYTIEFPKGLIDKTDDLPSGREWELIIDKGAFIDYSDKKLGDEYVSTSSNSIKDFEAGTIKVPTYDNKNSFWSDKVATPVVRVDRYSYGLGIWQSDASGNKAGQILDDNVEPTGYVRVRIDCETKNAAIQYIDDQSRTGNKDSSTTVLYTSDHDAIKSYGSTSTAFTTIPTFTTTPTKNYTDYTGIFAGGTAGYESSCKEYISARATKTGHTYDSATAVSVEGVFKTIVHFITPKTDSQANAADQDNTSATQRRTDYCIRGTTGLAGEPYISPFPLRDSQVGSPFVRRTFRESTKTEGSKDYYWVSFEVLVDASYSAYQWGPNVRYYDWARDWGIVTPGDYGKCTNLRGWQ